MVVCWISENADSYLQKCIGMMQFWIEIARKLCRIGNFVAVIM